MNDLYGQYGHGRGPALMPRKRRIGMPVMLASGATALALAGFFAVAVFVREESAEPLPPQSTPLEVAKAPTEHVTGSLPPSLLPTTAPPAKAPAPPALAEAPAPPPARTAPAPAPAAPPPPAPAPAAPPPSPLIQAQPQPAPTPSAPPAVVASAEVSMTLPSPIPPLVAPPAAPPPPAAAPAPAPTASPPPAPAAVAPAPKPRTGPSQAEISAFTSRARDLIKSGDIAGARLLLERAASGDDGPSLLALAETYDPAALSRWGVVGVRPDLDKARALYEKAAARGIPAAKDRMLALR